MAQEQERKVGSSISLPSYDAYWDTIQSRKKLPKTLQETLTDAFARIPVSAFPIVPRGQVIEIEADTSIAEAVKVLSEANILSAPVKKTNASDTMDWRERYLGIIDYSAIILWVLENAELAAIALSAGTATAAGVGAGAVGALGALAVGATGPIAVAGLTAAAVGAAVAGGVATEKGMGKDGPTAAANLGDDFYKVILQEEPFKSTTVKDIIKSFRWAPFLPVSTDSSMLSVMLLLSKYRLRSVPVIEDRKPSITNFITQSAIVQGLEGCKGRDWFDYISAQPISNLGLPFMTYNEVISIKGDDLILEAFKQMKEHKIGGLPVVSEPSHKLIGSISIRDIRFLLLQPELFSSFTKLTVIDFMKIVASTTQESGKVSPMVKCRLDSSMRSIIESLAKEKVHRAYVVSGEEECVVGVITLRDVISCFIMEPENHFNNYFGLAVQEMLSN
ncbi:SNF1-related protein kinase regulatory subunit gamma-1-like [Ranunculus cassubicifolius]